MTPDIIVPLTANPDGIAAWVYQDAINIDRLGTRPLVTPAGTEDKWRISFVARASMAQDGQALLDTAGCELEVPVPSPYQSRSVDVAAIAHDPRVLLAVALLREVMIDLHRGDLVPQVTEPNESHA